MPTFAVLSWGNLKRRAVKSRQRNLPVNCLRVQFGACIPPLSTTCRPPPSAVQKARQCDSLSTPGQGKFYNLIWRNTQSSQWTSIANHLCHCLLVGTVSKWVWTLCSCHEESPLQRVPPLYQKTSGPQRRFRQRDPPSNLRAGGLKVHPQKGLQRSAVGRLLDVHVKLRHIAGYILGDPRKLLFLSSGSRCPS